VDVGGFAEPRKILCQCVYPPMSNYQYTPGPRMEEMEFPNTFYKTTFFKLQPQQQPQYQTRSKWDGLSGYLQSLKITLWLLTI
jgi:hypothetical protein